MHTIINTPLFVPVQKKSFNTLPYLTLPVGWGAVKATPSTEATKWAQCAFLTDLKVVKSS